jgi:hypothetical protein
MCLAPRWFGVCSAGHKQVQRVRFELHASPYANIDSRIMLSFAGVSRAETTPISSRGYLGAAAASSTRSWTWLAAAATQ